MISEKETPVSRCHASREKPETKTMHLRLVVENHAPRQRIPWWDLLHPMRRLGMSASLRQYFEIMGASR
jgi:hypothetical protein